MFRNLPGSLDAAFVLDNRFYFFKQNFFYLNDAAGNPLINPQLMHDAFLVGCDQSRLPREVDMSRLFRAPQLIDYYCIRCPGYIANAETTGRNNKKGRIQSGKFLNLSNWNLIPSFWPIAKSTESPITDLTTKKKEDDKTVELGLTNALNKLEDFSLRSWTFFQQNHLLFGLLLLSIFFIIFLCQCGRESFSTLDDRTDEDLMRRTGRARRREMRRRNRRWN